MSIRIRLVIGEWKQRKARIFRTLETDLDRNP